MPKSTREGRVQIIQMLYKARDKPPYTLTMLVSESAKLGYDASSVRADLAELQRQNKVEVAQGGLRLTASLMLMLKLGSVRVAHYPKNR